MKYILCLLLLCCPVLAEELDPAYFPERLQWYTLSLSDTEQPLEWPEGYFLRLHFDQAITPDKGIWLAGEGGLFRRLQPSSITAVDDHWVWLFERPSQQPQQLLLTEFADTQPTLVAYSQQDQAPLLEVVSETLLHPQQQVNTNQSDGFAARKFNQIFPHQPLTYELEGPGQFNFVLQTQWLEAFESRALMEVSLAIDAHAKQNIVVKLQPQPKYLLQTPWCECQYSRNARITVTLGAGTHKVAVSADREILGYWTKDNSSDGYFYAHNAQLDFVKKSLQNPLNLAIASPPEQPNEDYSPQQPELSLRPAKYHFRELFPVNFSSGSFVDTHKIFKDTHNLNLWVSQKFKDTHNSDLWVSQKSFTEYLSDIAIKNNLEETHFSRHLISWLSLHSQRDEAKKGTKTDYYSHLVAGQSNRYMLPYTSHLAPLRLTVMGEGDRQHLTMTTNSGETQDFLYVPNDVEDQQPTVQIIRFEKAYQQVTLTNHGKTPVEVNLGYKNRSKDKTAESSYIAQMNPQAAKQIVNTMITHLANNNAIPVYPNTEHSDAILLTAETTDWQNRLSTRYQGFVGRYQADGIAGDVETTMEKFSQVSSSKVNDLGALMTAMEQFGMALPAKRWLVSRALQQSGRWQQQSEQLLLQSLAKQERWFDIEGYWTYRLVHYRQWDAIEKLAKVLLQQGQFELAAKWFWLAEQNKVTITQPAEAILASVLAGYQTMAQHWLNNNRKVSLPQHWYYWQSVTPELSQSAGTLIHNTGLDSYFNSLQLLAKKPQNLTLAGPGRFMITLYGKKDRQQAWSPSLTFTLAGLANQNSALHTQVELAPLSDSLALRSAILDNSVLASPQNIVFDLPPGKHALSLSLDNHDGLFTLQQQVDAMADFQGNDSPVPLDNYRLAPTVVSQPQLLAPPALPDHDWQPLQSISSSAGIINMTTDRWQPSTALGANQQLLFTDKVQTGERLVSSSGSELIELQTRETSDLHLRVRQISRFGYADSPATVVFEHDGTAEYLTLPIDLPLQLKAGSHQLRLSLANNAHFSNGKPIAEQSRAWAFFQITDKQGNSQLPELKRRFYRATADQPLILQLPADSWLRIEQLDENNQLTSQIQHYSKAQQLSLTPAKGQTASLFRVYRWQQQYMPTVTEPSDNPATDSQSTAAITYWSPDPALTMQAYDHYPADQQTDGTWGLTLGFRSRANLDEDTQTAKERFWQLGWRYRLNIPHWRSYFAADWQLRKHQTSQLQTLVGQNDWIWQPNRFWDIESSLNFYYQYQAPNPQITGGLGVFAQTSASWRQFWQDNLDNKLTLSAFARYLTLSENDIYPSNQENQSNAAAENGTAVDDDVWSDYKADHRQGLQMADTLQYDPYLDTRFRLHASLTSDHQGNFFNPQRISFTAGIRQYFEPLFFSLDLQQLRFKRKSSDSDNQQLLRRNSVRLAMTLEHWRPFGQLGQLQWYINRDLDSGQRSFGISFNGFFSSGQGYDDFAPSRLIFADLRRRMGFNRIQSNQVVADDHE